MEHRRIGIKWLNFLYSFFGLEILVKGMLAVGTVNTVLETCKTQEKESIFNGPNFISLCAAFLIVAALVFKLLACINSRKEEGYSLMIWALFLSTIASVFYVFFDRGLVTGLVFMVFASGLLAINYFYVKKRKFCFGNPELM